MTRFFPLLLGLFVVASACAQDGGMDHSMDHDGAMADHHRMPPMRGTDDARVMAEPITDAPMQEQFEIRFADVTEDSATMILHWGTVGVPVTITEAGM